jgi:hypothetical protein
MQNLHVIPSLCIEIALFEGTFLSFCLLDVSLTKLASAHRACNCHGTILMSSNCSGAGMVRRPVFLRDVCLPKLVELSLAFTVKPPLITIRVYEDIQQSMICDL